MSFKDINKVLTTTRSVRRRLDFSRPIAPELIEECLEIAVQAPTAKNAQEWRFIVVIDPAQRAALGAIYRNAFLEKWGDTNVLSDSPNSEQARMMASARYLVEHIGQAPVLILFCAETALEPDSLFELSNLYGTIMPAAWSFMLAGKITRLGLLLDQRASYKSA